VRAANDVLRFCLELAMLAALAALGFAVADGVLQWLLAVALPLVAATLWGVYMSPKASRPLVADPQRLLAEGAFFGAATAALAIAGAGVLAAVLGALAAVHLALTFPLGQRRA
jgi:Protein of unknown function (DUF2568)